MGRRPRLHGVTTLLETARLPGDLASARYDGHVLRCRGKVKGPAGDALVANACDLERMKLSQKEPDQSREQWENDDRPAAQTAKRPGFMSGGLLFCAVTDATRIARRQVT
jgi:hypothetical protein